MIFPVDFSLVISLQPSTPADKVRSCSPAFFSPAFFLRHFLRTNVFGKPLAFAIVITEHDWQRVAWNAPLEALHRHWNGLAALPLANLINSGGPNALDSSNHRRLHFGFADGNGSKHDNFPHRRGRPCAGGWTVARLEASRR